jgi:hypothetical protein
MTKLYPLLLSLFFLPSGPAAAQAPSPLQPVQRIALGPTATLGGSVQLPNHNTVLLLTDTEQPGLRAVCLSAEGRTLWETPVERYQPPRLSSGGLFAPPGVTGRTQEEISRNTLRYNASLRPVSVFTEGNNVLLVERIDAATVKKMPKGSALRENQVYVQRLDEQGHLAKAHFEPRPQPQTPPEEPDAVVGHYADASGYVEIMRTTAYPSKKERTQAFTLCHYDLGTSAPRTEPLALPATPWLTGSWDMFRLWYQDWAFLGHRPNQNYFCRRLLVNSTKERAGDQPLQFQILITDDHGAVAPGGFSTTLGLNKNTSPAYSGAIPNYGELDYAHAYYSVPMFNNRSVSQDIVYDAWQSTGVGSFYLDYATGDVLIFGEYGEGELPYAGYRPDLLGFFEQRFSATGSSLARLQAPYLKTLTAHTKGGSFVGQIGRSVRFHLDPLSGESQYSFSPMHVMGTGEDFDVFADHNLQLERMDHTTGNERGKALYTTVLYTRPTWLYKSDGYTPEQRRYTHAAPTDPPVYRALEQLNAAAPLPFHEFHLSAITPGTGLVIECSEAIGGNLQVYRF